MIISVIIPCYNESATIESILHAVRACGLNSLEIIVVDDCSTDGTCETLRRIVEPSGLADMVLYHDHNRGKGAA